MKIITINEENLISEHICCAIANNNDIQVATKKEWLRCCFRDGLVFMKCDVRGKCFIEYVPAEKAWRPIIAKDYMFINCFWIAGQYKGLGYANLLLDECIKDSKARNKKGLCVLSSKKKRAFLSDPQYLKYKGFMLADTFEPYYGLLYLPFEETAEKPCFNPAAKTRKITEPGFALYYSHQCPFTAKYVALLKEVAKKKGITFKSTRFETAEAAQQAAFPGTTYSLFYNGEFITHEILSIAKFEKLLQDKGY